MKKQLLNLFIGASLCSLFGSTLLTASFAPSSLCAQVPSYVPTSGPAAWYSFSGNANDDSGGNNNGSVNGATLTQGKLGLSNTAYSFDGLSNTIDFSNPFLNGAQVGSFTMHVLVNFSSTGNSPNIWGKTYNWGEANFFVSSNNEIKFVFANNVTGNKYSTIYSAPNAILPNQWNDIVITYGNSSGQIFVNGVPVTTYLQWTAQGGSSLSTTQIEAQCNFAQFANSSKIGLRYTGGVAGNYIDGIVDEFGIWDRVLTQSEIDLIYNNCMVSFTNQPTNQSVAVSVGTAQFNVTTSATSPTYQWQTNLGVGYQNLSDVGQYSGSSTNSLTVSNVSMSNNNQPFRCIVTSGGCADTSNVAILTVINDAGIEDNTLATIKVFPNPVTEVINILLTDEKNEKYMLIDANGRILQQGELTSKESQISVKSLPSGSYVLKVGKHDLPIRVVKE